MILSHAASLRSKMRKSFKGAPARERRCWRCGATVMGQRLLLAHLAMCAAGPLEELGPEDLVAWEPPNAE